MSDDYPKRIYMASEPEHLGKIPVRTELTVLPADDPSKPKIGFMVYELKGTDLYPWPDGHTGVFRDEADLEQWLTDDRLLTTREALQPGMKLLVHDLFGWGQGITLLDPQGKVRVMSPSGKILYMTDFVNDRPPAPDGTPAPPRWVCVGSANLAGLKRLEITR